jgi:hypothetical protein
MKISYLLFKRGKRCLSVSRDDVEDNICLVSIREELLPIFFLEKLFKIFNNNPQLKVPIFNIPF